LPIHTKASTQKQLSAVIVRRYQLDWARLTPRERSNAEATIATVYRQPRSSLSPLLKSIDCHNLEGDAPLLRQFLSAKKIEAIPPQGTPASKLI
jgi:hypothetical protein